jgi:serine/threonine protein kinase
VLGTVGYMSPEQASGKPVDFRSDQFSLGAILYELATGKRAFQRGTAAETLTAIIREEPEPPAALNPAIPTPFRWILERCLQKDPEERYASTRDLARDIKSIREHLSNISEPSSTGEALRPTAAKKAFAGGRGFLRLALSAAALLAAVGAGAFLHKSLAKSVTPSYQQITFGSGTIRAARFAPDGQTIVYSCS